MNNQELLEYFNKHFKNQVVHLNGDCNQVLKILNEEAKRHGMVVHYVMVDETSSAVKKEMEVKQDNRLSVQIEERGNLHQIRCVLNF